MNFLTLINGLIDRGCTPSQSVLSKSGAHFFCFLKDNQSGKIEYGETEKTIKVFKRNCLRYTEINRIALNEETTIEETASEIVAVFCSKDQEN